MSLHSTRLAISRTGWIIYVMAEVALFLVANFTAKDASHPGAVSNIFFITFIAGLVLGLLLGAAALIRDRTAAR